MVKYHSRIKTRSEVDVITKIERGAIMPGESDYYEDVPLKIEAVVPNLLNCHIIDLDYKVRVSLIDFNMYSDLLASS